LTGKIKRTVRHHQLGFLAVPPYFRHILTCFGSEFKQVNIIRTIGLYLYWTETISKNQTGNNRIPLVYKELYSANGL